MSRSYRNSSNSTRWTSNATSAHNVPPISHECESLKSLRDQAFDGQRTGLLIAVGPLLQILGYDVGLDVDGIARLERAEVRHLDRMWDDGDGQPETFQLRDR